METDALDYALAAILSIVNEDNEVHPITFHSLLQWSWTTTHMTRNCLSSLKLSRFDSTIWKVQPIPLMLLWIIRILSIFLLPRYWPRGKYSGPSTSPSSTLLSGSTLVVLAPNQMLSLDSRGEYWLHHSQPSQLQAHLHSRTICSLYMSYRPSFPFSLCNYSHGFGHFTSRHPLSSS